MALSTASTRTRHSRPTWQLEEWLGSAASQKIMGEGGYIWPAIPSLDPLFTKAWAAKGIPMAPFSRSRGNVVDWPNTPGMNQALTDMQISTGHFGWDLETLSKTKAALSSAYAAADRSWLAAAYALLRAAFVFDSVSGPNQIVLHGGLHVGEGLVHPRRVGPVHDVAHSFLSERRPSGYPWPPRLS